MKIENIQHTLGRYWFLILVAVLIVWGLIDDSSSDSTLPAPAPVAEQAAPQEPLPPAVSLANGTIIKRVPAYLQGDGELTISNGTAYDAVAKLITNGASGTSVLTAYVKAYSDYTMQNIGDGSYRLIFAQGTDWDSDTKTFTRDRSYSSFDDSFEFETSDTQYTTYSITLNAVEGGTAETSNVNEDQFDAY